MKKILYSKQEQLSNISNILDTFAIFESTLYLDNFKQSNVFKLGDVEFNAFSETSFL